jgi:hypothetical protein
MNKFKFEAFLSKFPFLREILGEEFTALEVDYIGVRRADENFLARVPREADWKQEETHFYCNNGTLLKNAIVRQGSDGQGETVLEALSRLNNPDDVKYIIWGSTDYPFCAEERCYYITIYKPPKEVKFSDLIRQAQEKALAKVKKEIDL